MLKASQHKNSSRVQIEQLWNELGHDPAQRALACASFCTEHAPHLAEALKARILAQISDRELLALLQPPVTDGRILAYNQLCAVTDPPPPRPKPKPVPVAKPVKRAGQTSKPFTLFGVPIRVIGDRPAASDPELARLANGLGYAAVFRLWLISRDLDNGVGRITKDDLEAQLGAFGVSHTRRYLNRLLQRRDQ